MIGVAFFLFGMAVFTALLEGSRFIAFIKKEVRETYRTFTRPIFVNPRGIDYTLHPQKTNETKYKYTQPSRFAFHQ